MRQDVDVLAASDSKEVWLTGSGFPGLMVAMTTLIGKNMLIVDQMMVMLLASRSSASGI